jgi:peptidoglycan-associated lipoprotein
MQNLLIVFITLFLTSCFGDNQIIIEEEKINKSGASVLSSEFEEKSIASANNNSNSFESRGTLNSFNEAFSSEDIEIAADEKLVATGVRSYSSNYAKEAIAAVKTTDPELSFVIYFAFDSDGLDDNSKAILAKHKKILSDYPELKLRLEGHTDPKGSREYNLALGELRAIAVRDWLAHKADVVSFGEEKIISTDDAKNRRAEIIYK